MRRLTSVLASLTLATGALFSAGSPAQAATCATYGCDGKNPETTGCSTSSVSSPLTVSAGYGDWYLELRRSSGCGAYWARVRNYHHVTYESATISVDRRANHNGATGYQTKQVFHGQAVAYTNMWGRAGGYTYRACITFDQSRTTTCTVWIS